MAVVRRTARGTELGLARINRMDPVTVDGWRPLDLNQQDRPPISRVVDVAWLDATELLVLGAASEEAAAQPFRVAGDASEITVAGEAVNWDPVQVAVLLSTQTGVVVGRERSDLAR